MPQNSYVAASEITRTLSEVIDSLDKGPKTIMRYNRPIAYLIGVDDPLSKLVGVAPPKSDLDLLESFSDTSLGQPYQQLFMQVYGVELTKGANSIDRLIGVDNPELMRQLPGKDHCNLWERDGVPALFTMEVYGMHMDTHNALRDFCIEHGLVYRTEKRSWHYPGVSTLIVIEKKKEGR